MTLHIDTDWGKIPPYAIMIMLSFAAGIGSMFFLNVKSGVRKHMAGYLSLLAPFMSIFFGLLLTYITTFGKGVGLSSLGGLFGMYAAVVTIALIGKDRREFMSMLTSCTLVVPLMYSISKIGCLCAGCCRGIAYHGAFCIEYTGKRTGDICVFPVQLAETLLFFAIFVTGIILFMKKKQNTELFVIIASVLGKGGLDFLRASHTDKIISLNQILCIVIAAVGIVGYKYFKKLRVES
ncbi:Prolipoprotein diacylglyceryltransferase [Ruminococcus flavefaciens]|uniref:Prolipoprotein diacylglyceryltransferase n=1 Tax=Ruminococcus flavefaciens TaxID=1265 RepID=A0A1H6I828_RUMFL|nr:prolipoprotein diacylglyceryl transferase family protein [Ruminococcus flavefaciens]SEH42375.1 Prolipoprotein diacylglyceryltransferase [Ruminococcus flavefaciens]